MYKYKFQDLTFWQKTHELVIEIYNITSKFPDEEKFGLISQMRRASVSITSNIAEGYGYPTKKNKIKFCFVANASLIELENQIILSRDLKYISEDQYNRLTYKLIESKKLLSGLIKYYNS